MDHVRGPSIKIVSSPPEALLEGKPLLWRWSRARLCVATSRNAAKARARAVATRRRNARIMMRSIRIEASAQIMSREARPDQRRNALATSPRTHSSTHLLEARSMARFLCKMRCDSAVHVRKALDVSRWIHFLKHFSSEYVDCSWRASAADNASAAASHVSKASAWCPCNSRPTQRSSVRNAMAWRSRVRFVKWQ